MKALKTYIINQIPQQTGVHEFHNLRACVNLPDLKNHLILGLFNDGNEAYQIAKQKYPDWEIEGCEYCVPDYHSR